MRCRSPRGGVGSDVPWGGREQGRERRGGLQGGRPAQEMLGDRPAGPGSPEGKAAARAWLDGGHLSCSHPLFQ